MNSAESDVKMTKNLCKELSSLAQAVREASEHRKSEFEWFKSHFKLATKQDLENIRDQIMSVISVWAEKQKAFNDRQAVAIDGIVADIQVLNDKITELQNTSGTITPEDQALLDGIQVHTEGIVAKLEALDASNPPVIPPVPPTP